MMGCHWDMSRFRSLMVGWFTGVSRASRTTVFSAGARTKTYMLDELKPTQVQQRNAQVPCVTGKQNNGFLYEDTHSVLKC